MHQAVLADMVFSNGAHLAGVAELHAAMQWLDCHPVTRLKIGDAFANCDNHPCVFVTQDGRDVLFGDQPD